MTYISRTTTCDRYFCPSDGAAEHETFFDMRYSQQIIGKASADIIVAVIATFVSLFNPFVGLLISLAWAAIPFLKENATQQERAICCAEVIFAFLTAMIPNPIVSLLVQVCWIFLSDDGE